MGEDSPSLPSQNDPPIFGKQYCNGPRSLTSPALPAGPHHAAKTTGMKTWISRVNLNHAQ